MISEGLSVSTHEWCALGAEAATDKYSVQTSTDTRAIEALRPEWQKLSRSLETDIDYYLNQLRQNPATWEPYAIAVYGGNAVQSMLVGHIKTQRASAIVSFVKVSGPEVRVLEIMHGGLMGHASATLDKLLASELLKIVESGAVDSLCFQRLPLRSGLLREIRRLPGLRGKLRIPHRFSYSVLPLPAPNGKTEQLFPGKTRREFRRKARILERTFPGQVSLRTFSLPAELDDGLRDAMSVAVSTWQRYLDLGLSDTAQTREALRFFAEMGWLRIFILYIQGVPCAFLAGQLYNNTFYSQFAGYHLDYARFSVGSVLIGRAFREIAASGVRDVDLGEGGQDHNRRLGCPMHAEATVHIYAPTPRGKLLKLFFGSLQVVRRGGRRTQSSLRLDWLAKIWRQELLSRRSPPLSS